MNVIACLLSALTLTVNAQIMLEESIITLNTKGGRDVVAYASRQCQQCYFYLPSELQVSRKRDNGVPEISFLTWKDDEGSRIQGGILHFLLEWDITPEIERHLTSLIEARDKAGKLIGPASVIVREDVSVRGTSRLAQILRASLTTPPITATTPGAKMAFSFRIDEKFIDEFLALKDSRNENATIHTVYSYEVISESGLQKINNRTLSIPVITILKMLDQ